MDLDQKRDRLFREYERGVRGPGELRVRFVELMLDAPDDMASMSLYRTAPDWFRKEFRSYVDSCSKNGFGNRWSAIGETRTMEEIDEDARRHGDILERLAPEILRHNRDE